MATTGSTLVTEVRREADIEGETTRHPDAIIFKKLSYAIKSLYRRLGISDPHSYLRRIDDTLTTTANQATLALPTDFRMLFGLDVKIDGDWYRAHPLPHLHRNLFQDEDGFDQVQRTYYQLEADSSGTPQLRLYPTPTTAHSVRVWYAPSEPTITASSDSAELFGFEEYVVIVASIAMKRRSDLPIDELQLRKQELERELVRFAYRLDRSTGLNVPQDVRRAPPTRFRWRNVE